MKKTIMVIILMLVSVCSYAIQPVEGAWDDPNAPGRGATIEIQNGIMVITYFGYGDDRSDRWWQGVGFETFNGSNIYTGTLNAFEGGQCIGCSYQQNSINESSSAGSFSIKFNTWTDAEFQWAGGTDNLVKLDWGYAGQKSYLYGSWLISSFFSSGTSSGENAIVFHSELDDGETEYVVGNRSGYEFTGDYMALASQLEVEGQEYIFILYDSSTSYYRAYLFLLNENKATGRGWLYRKDEELSGDGLITGGAKMFDRYELQIDTSKTSLDKDSGLQETINEHYYKSLPKEAKTTNEKILGELTILENKMSELKSTK